MMGSMKEAPQSDFQFNKRKILFAVFCVCTGLVIVIHALNNLINRPQQHEDYGFFLFLFLELPAEACLISAGFGSFVFALVFKRFWTGAVLGLLAPALLVGLFLWHLMTG